MTETCDDEQYLRCWHEAGHDTRDGVAVRILLAADWVVNAAACAWPDPAEAPEPIRLPLIFLCGSIDDNDPLTDDRDD
jgi:hypothetical protein